MGDEGGEIEGDPLKMALDRRKNEEVSRNPWHLSKYLPGCGGSSWKTNCCRLFTNPSSWGGAAATKEGGDSYGMVICASVNQILAFSVNALRSPVSLRFFVICVT